MKSETITYSQTCGVLETPQVYKIERYENVLPLTDVEYGGKYKAYCEICPKYGKNLSCPPHSPGFAEYAEKTSTAKIICYKISLRYFMHLADSKRYRAGFTIVKRLLTDELLAYRRKGNIIAGSGSCTACHQCDAEINETICKKPEKKVFSLESLGVNVVALISKSFDMELEWSQNGHIAGTVSATGAVFI